MTKNARRKSNYQSISLLLTGILVSAPIQAFQLTDSAELILNASWYQYDYEISSQNRTEHIPVSGTQTTIGIALPDWTITWTPSAASGNKNIIIANGLAQADYRYDANALSITRYFYPWYIRAGYSQSESDLEIRSAIGRIASEKTQKGSDWSIEGGKNWQIGQWNTNTYAGLIHSGLTIDQTRIIENGQIQEQEEIDENYLATGVSASYYWETSGLTPGIGLDYQRRLSSNSHSQTSLFGQRGRPIGRATGTSQSSGLVNWSAAYVTLDYEFSHLGLSLYYQYELNEPHQGYTNIAFYLLF